MPEPVKPTWLERAKATHKFHKSKVISNAAWTKAMTAKVLCRSTGSVSEDLMIVRWLKTHENQIEKFEYAYEAIEFIRKRKKLEEL